MTNKEIVEKIIEKLGGKDNILRVENCMTRLRAEVLDNTKTNMKEIKSLDSVLGIVEEGSYKQIIVGPGKAKKLCDMAKELINQDVSKNIGDWQTNKDFIKKSHKTNPFKNFLKTIGQIFIPLIPAVIAAGLFNGFGGLITNLQTVGSLPSEGFWLLTKHFLTLMGGGFLGYFVIFTGINSAIQFKATPALGGMIGAMSIMGGINTISAQLGLFNADVPLDSILITGKGGIIGVIIGVFILSKVENSVRKLVPDVLDLVITPVITLIITSLIFVLAVMPLSGILSDGLIYVLSILIGSTNPVVNIISGFVLSAAFLPMVLLGLHHGLIPIYAIQLEAFGGVSLFPVLAMAGAGQVGAAISIYFKAKKSNKTNLTKIITGALPAGILGIGEPLIYGVTLPLGKPFVTAGLGAGFGGAYVMLTHVLASSWGPSGIVAIPLMQPDSMLNYVIGILISYTGGFLVTQLFLKDEDLNKS